MEVAHEVCPLFFLSTQWRFLDFGEVVETLLKNYLTNKFIYSIFAKTFLP